MKPKKSHSVTFALAIVLSLSLVPQTLSPTNYEYMFKSYFQYRLDDFNTYVKFALDLYVDKIIWHSDKFEVLNAKMGGGAVSDAWFKITKGNLTVLTFFENCLLKMQLDGNNGESGILEFYAAELYEPFKIYANGHELSKELDWSYNHTQNSVTIQITYESSLIVEVYWTESLTYNGITLSKRGNIVIATSPNKYNFTIGTGEGTARHWNLTRLDSTPNEMVFRKIHYWFRINDTGQTSSQSALLTTSNATFTDSLGSGIKFNMTFSTVWVGSQPKYGFTVYQILWFYPNFIIEELTLKNDCSNAVRRLQSPNFIVYSGYKNFKVGPGETTRFMGMGTVGYDKLISTEEFATRPPFFAYNTAENKGVVIGFLKNTWDWLVRRQYYNGTEDPSAAITVDTCNEYPNEYIDIAYGQTYQLGKMFIELTGRQADTAFANLGKVYKTLYPGRKQLSGNNVAWNSWSAYGDNVFENNITQAIDYIAANLKNSRDVDTIVIDNGYQNDVGNWTQVKANWGNHDLQWMASYITSKGLKAGIWITPWLIGPYALNNATMKSWLLNDTHTGSFKIGSLDGLTYYVLNPTISEARNFVANQINTLEQWGFSYFKLDFIQEVMDAKQMYGSGNTRATWIEFAFNISTVVDNNHYVCELGVQPFATMQPYLAQQYANSVRFSMDLSDMSWKYTLDAYYAYHTAAPIFNHLTVNLDRDMLGDSARFADSPWTKISDNQYRFHLTFLGITKIFDVSENYNTANQTKLTWVKNFLPFTEANWTQRDYWEHTGIPRTWLTHTTLMNNTYYYLAVFNPTDSQETNTISFSTNLNLPSGTYLIYDNYADSYLGTNSSSLIVTLGARDARIFTLLRRPLTPAFFVWNEKDHISTSQIISATWANNQLNYTLSMPSGTTSITKVYCGEEGEPTRVLVDNIEQPINYNSSTRILTVTATHSSNPTEILVDWNLYPPKASFFYSPLNPYVNDTITFNASSSRPNGGHIVSYKWSFGNGATEIYVSENLTAIATHEYTMAGTYEVTLNVTDSEGLWNSTTTTVTVKMRPPPSIWKVEHSPELPEYNNTVTVTANITSQESVIGIVILNYFNGSMWTNTTMTMQNDLYVATIPVLPYGTTVQYKVYASNDFGNWAETDTSSYTVTDTIPPDIAPVQWSPKKPSPSEGVLVSTQVSEPAFASGIKNVTLLWSVNGKKILSLTMIMEDDVWKATIPGQSDDTRIFFSIESYDDAGNCAKSQWNGYTVKAAATGPPLLMLAITAIAIVTVLILVTIWIIRRRRKAKDKA